MNRQELIEKFEPFDDSWQKEMMKATKPFIIEMFKKSQQENLSLHKSLDKYIGIAQGLSVELEGMKRLIGHKKREIDSLKTVVDQDVSHWKSKYEVLKSKIDEAEVLWVATDDSGGTCLYEMRPERDIESSEWLFNKGDIDMVYFGISERLSNYLFPSLKWEDEPIKVALVTIEED